MNETAATARVALDRIIEPKGFLGLELLRGQVLRIVDVDGKQVPDLVCFNLHDRSERLSNNNSMLIQKRWKLSTGSVLFSDEGNPMLTIVEDTVGIHHPSGGCCNEAANVRRYGQRGDPNCLDNLAAAAAPFGVTKKEIPGAFCPFMNVVRREDGAYEIVEPTSAPGDHIDFRAEMDLFVAISNCPQERNPCNGFKATRLQAIVFDPAAA